MSLSVVLVRTKYSQNIGAASRAIANMANDGKIILIEPKAEIDIKSYQSAAGAQKILDKIQIFRSWEDYKLLYPEVIRIGFTARQGENRIIYEWSSLVSKIETSITKNPHLVFGPEDNGLSDLDLTHCNFSTVLRTYGEFSSLNISQAVLLALYIWSHNINSEKEATHEMKFSQIKNLTTEVIDLDLLKRWLLKSGFNLSSPKVNAFKILNKFFVRSLMTNKEKSVFEKLIQINLRK
jgi:TrmH family RNA methyltransferase